MDGGIGVRLLLAVIATTYDSDFLVDFGIQKRHRCEEMLWDSRLT